MCGYLRVSKLLVIAAFAIGSANMAHAQEVVLQQPVVQQFGVNTVVSVPDRGSALLGSVGRSQRANRRGGPFRSGENVSRSLQHGSLMVHVTIHGFSAMDAALLDQSGDRETAATGRHCQTVENPMVRNASRQLLHRHQELSRRIPLVDEPRDLRGSRPVPDSLNGR